MKVISRGIGQGQERLVGDFQCPECTSIIHFNSYDIVRWSPGDASDRGIYSARCPVCGEHIPETAATDSSAGKEA